MLDTRQRGRLLVFSCLSLIMLACGMFGLGALVLFQHESAAVASAQPANRIVYGLTFMPSGFDPHINASSELTIPLRSVYDTLVYRDPQSKGFVPGLAQDVQVSPDGLVYTFQLKSGVVFHDGTPFDAAAVGATLDRITAPETQSQKALFMLGPYDKYVIVDPLTIQIILKRPHAALLDALAQTYLGIASPKALQEYDRDRYQLHQVGTGPYQMVEYIPGDYMLLRRNPNYTWGPPFYNLSNSTPVEEIEFRFFTDPATRAPALETGAVQIMGEISPLDAQGLARADQFALVPQPIPGMPFQFFFNTNRAPTDNLNLRRALIVATNRVAIVDTIFQQFSPPAYGPLSSVTPFYDGRVKEYYTHDAAAAKRALGALGYTDSDGDQFLDLNGTKLTLIMLVPAWSNAPQIAQKIQSQWREIGVDLELRQVPGLAALREAMQTNEYHLLAFNDFGVDASLLNSFYLSSGPNNWAKFSNGEMDGWLTRAAESIDPIDRQNLYSAVQGLIMDQALILPIRDSVNLNGVNKQIGNLQFDAYGWAPVLVNLTFNKVE